MPTLFASGTITGSTTLSGSAALAQLLSGTTGGSGVLAIPPLLASGTVIGASTLTGGVVLQVNVVGFIQGQGALSLAGYPDTTYGTSSLTGELVVEQAPPPVCACRIPKPVAKTKCSCGGVIVVLPESPCSCDGSRGVLRWDQFFQPGDLMLFLRNSFGPIMPNSVSYTLYWIRNGIPYQAGPANRVPARGPRLGEFYVTGRIGEFGQPGMWMVRWYYQRNFYSASESVDYRFTVQDAVAAADPRDTTVRYLKYGWG